MKFIKPNQLKRHHPFNLVHHTDDCKMYRDGCIPISDAIAKLISDPCKRCH